MELAPEIAERRASPAEVARFKYQFVNNIRFRHFAASILAVKSVRDELTEKELSEECGDSRWVKAAIQRTRREIERAFETAYPTPEQVRLRERAWSACPHRTMFPTLDVATMRLPGEDPPMSREEAMRRRRQRECMRDRREYWTADRDYDFTIGELLGKDERFRRVRLAIADGAIGYAWGALTLRKAAHFEHWYSRSRAFRLFAIPYLAVAKMEDAAETARDVLRGESVSRGNREGQAVVRALALFRFERSTPEQLEAARALWSEDAAGPALPAVDLMTGELAECADCHTSAGRLP